MRQEFFGLLFGAEHAFFTRGVDEFCAEGAHERLLFLRELGGHHEYDADAAVERCKSDAEARIACGGFDNGSARFQEALFNRVVHHVKAGAVLHAARGVPKLQFGKQVYAFGESHVRKLYKRSLPD